MADLVFIPDPTRRPSHRSSAHPSISEEPSPPSPSIITNPAAAATTTSANLNLGRSKSWRQPTNADDWRYNGAVQGNMSLSRGVSTSASENNHTYHYGGGHQRTSSYTTHLSSDQDSNPTSSPLDSAFAVHPTRTAGGLHKSASLRSNASQSSNTNSIAGQGAYTRSLLNRGRISPASGVSPSINGSLNWDHLTSPTFAKSEDNHAIQARRNIVREDQGADGSTVARTSRGIDGPILGIGQGIGAPSIGYPQQQHQTLMQQSSGADVRRHQSLQQGFGHSTKVQERLARSQALLPPEQRTSGPSMNPASPLITADRDRRLSDIASGSSARNVWSLNDDGNDGWEQVDVAMRARANHTPLTLAGPYQSTTPLSRQQTHTPPVPPSGNTHLGEQLYPAMQQATSWDPSYPPDLMQRDNLAQAFQAMQLGSEMLMPAPGSLAAGSQINPHPLMSTSALDDLYRNALMPYPVQRAHPIAPGAYPENVDYNASYGHAQQAVSPIYAGFAAPSVHLMQGPSTMPPPTHAAPQQHAQHYQHHQHQVPQTQAVPDHIARAAEAEVQLMIAKRGLNPYDFGCQPDKVSLSIHRLWYKSDIDVVLLKRRASLSSNHLRKMMCTSR